MPLHVRLRNDHYPHDEPSTRLDYYVVFSGGLEVGGFHRIGSGPSKGRWSWGAAIGTDDTTFTEGGYAAYPEVCCTLIALAFRRTLARADLRERPDAKPGPPRRAPPDAIVKPSPPTPPYDREVDRWLGPMVRSERHVFVRSGELIVGVLNRATHGPESWSWSMTGVSRPHDEDFVWRGHRLETEEQAFAALVSWWTRWLDWSGLEQVVPLHAEEAWVTKHPRQAPNHDRKLARHVVLADGRRLRTLKDAADLLVDVFGSANDRSHALDHANRVADAGRDDWRALRRRGGDERDRARAARPALAVTGKRSEHSPRGKHADLSQLAGDAVRGRAAPQPWWHLPAPSQRSHTWRSIEKRPNVRRQGIRFALTGPDHVLADLNCFARRKIALF